MNAMLHINDIFPLKSLGTMKVDLLCFLQLYSSVDFGRKWQLVHENVMPGRFYWYDARAIFPDIDRNLMLVLMTPWSVRRIW